QQQNASGLRSIPAPPTGVGSGRQCRLPDDRGVRGNGYGRFGLIGSSGWRLVLAHRVAWTFTHGDNPEGSAIAVEASVASTYPQPLAGATYPPWREDLSRS